ncbi:hypothetical protein NA57DRAFT_50837 [Rhizodiscina lignyota]|uniref:Uncharacterized protein n=1 Tax=Rhizodiscina lignyota TaxID=1504668 RepID=A0A9P4IT47_9PEZI|nr:hypothetical protein NA57DRAFT_50837 [Rhizodiscina lignyota]
MATASDIFETSTVADTRETPRLDTLPEEIISIINVDFLDRKDECSTRLVCRALEEKTFHDFARTHFSHLQVLLTRDGLQRLTEISNHPRLSSVVRELVISLAFFSDPVGDDEDDDEMDDMDDDDDGMRPAIAPEHLAAYKRFALDQHYLLSVDLGGTVYSAFCHALKNFSKCESIGLQRWPRGLGKSAFNRACGTYFRPCKSLYRIQHLGMGLFQLLWRAVAESKASITRFAMGAPNTQGDQISFEPNIFCCPDHRLPDLRVALKNLTQLQLNVDLDSLSLRLYRLSFHQFLECAENLEILHLDFGLMNNDDAFKHLLGPSDDLASIKHPPVKELFINNADNLENSVMRGFVGLFASSLEGLHLHTVELHNTWKDDVPFFREKLRLKQFCMKSCTDEDNAGMMLMAHRSWLEMRVGCTCPHTIEYEGTEMDEYLKDLADRMVYVHGIGMRVGWMHGDVDEYDTQLDEDEGSNGSDWEDASEAEGDDDDDDDVPDLVDEPDD